MSPEWVEVAREGRGVAAVEIVQAPLEVDTVASLGQIGVAGLGLGADSELPARSAQSGTQVQAGYLRKKNHEESRSIKMRESPLGRSRSVPWRNPAILCLQHMAPGALARRGPGGGFRRGTPV